MNNPKTTVTLDRQVPYISQNMTLSDGFINEQEARYLSSKACGAACLKAILIALGGKAEGISVKELTLAAIRDGYYRNEIGGWIHKGIIQMAKGYGLDAKRKNIFNKPWKLIKYLSDGYLIMVSVSLYFNPIKQGGHLIVIKGVEFVNHKIITVYFSDPSAWGKDHSEISAEQLFNSWNGNIICFKKKKKKFNVDQ